MAKNDDQLDITKVVNPVQPGLNLNWWPCFEDGRAPIVVMSPTAAMSPTLWKAWLHDYVPTVIAPGWDGTHTPLQGKWKGKVQALARKNGLNGLVTSLWLFGDEQSGSTLSNWAERRGFTRMVVNKLRDTPGWKIVGLGYDIQEWATEKEVQNWYDFCRSLNAPRFLFGARAVPGVTYAGDFAAHEDQVKSLALMGGILKDEISRSGGRPLWNSERFRVRGSPPSKDKDWWEKDIPGGIRRLRRNDVGAIFGMGENVSDVGSNPPQSRASAARIRKALGVEPAPSQQMKYCRMSGASWPW
ncbi:hypothetical protein LCGC14_2337700 [marine sediment metagenome]|uniref:Uncharacterized protein n=1 Tax=marine sediment metagenome TaxID=412755 RepID=A0A0F9F7Y6_9ZZZZ